MSTDAAPTPTLTPTPAPVPTETWIERQEHAIAQATHNLVVYLDPLRVEIERQLAQVAHETWQRAAAWTADYFERNKAELAAKVAEAIIAAVIKQFPGVNIEADQISQFIVTQAGEMFSVLIAELRKEGQIIAPTPAPAPAPPAPSPAPAPAPEPSK